VLWLCGPATGENRTVGSQDRTVEKKTQKETFLQLRLQIGANSHEIGEKIKQIPDNPRIRPADSNILARSPIPPSRTGTPKTRIARSKNQNEQASQHGSERAGGEEPGRRGGDSRIGSGEVRALEL
jgi:hypothetical protein